MQCYCKNDGISDGSIINPMYFGLNIHFRFFEVLYKETLQTVIMSCAGFVLNALHVVLLSSRQNS